MQRPLGASRSRWRAIGRQTFQHQGLPLSLADHAPLAQDRNNPFLPCASPPGCAAVTFRGGWARREIRTFRTRLRAPAREVPGTEGVPPSKRRSFWGFRDGTAMSAQEARPLGSISGSVHSRTPQRAHARRPLGRASCARNAGPSLGCPGRRGVAVAAGEAAGRHPGSAHIRTLQRAHARRRMERGHPALKTFLLPADYGMPQDCRRARPGERVEGAAYAPSWETVRRERAGEAAARFRDPLAGNEASGKCHMQESGDDGRRLRRQLQAQSRRAAQAIGYGFTGGNADRLVHGGLHLPIRWGAGRNRRRASGVFGAPGKGNAGGGWGIPCGGGTSTCRLIPGDAWSIDIGRGVGDHWAWRSCDDTPFTTRRPATNIRHTGPLARQRISQIFRGTTA